MARKETCTELLRYPFSQEEIAKLSRDLALACQTKVTAEEEKKAAMAGFKDRIDRASADLALLSRHINNGWEMRDMVCDIQYNTPVMGTKRIARQDTGETVRDVAMSPSEYQEQIDFAHRDGKLTGPEREQYEKDKDQREARNKSLEAIRDWFKNPEASIEPVEVDEICGFQATQPGGGLWIVAAVDVEAATKYFTDHEIAIEGEIIMCDKDATYFEGLAQTYGDDSRTIRVAIMKMAELGHSFPCLLSFPAVKAAEAQAPPAEATGDAYASDGQAPPEGKPKAKRKRKKKGDAPVEPDAPTDDDASTDDEDDSTDDDAPVD